MLIINTLGELINVPLTEAWIITHATDYSDLELIIGEKKYYLDDIESWTQGTDIKDSTVESMYDLAIERIGEMANKGEIIDLRKLLAELMDSCEATNGH